MSHDQLREAQISAGALMGDFPEGGIPVSFGNPEGEYAAAMHGCGFTDLSMFGRIEVTGNDRLELLHRLSTNDLSGARPGEVRSTIFLSDKGRIVDRVLLMIGEKSILMVTSPGAEELVSRWIGKYTITEDIILKKVTVVTAMFCILGPSMDSVVLPLGGKGIAGNQWGPFPPGGSGGLLATRAESRHRTALAIVPAPEGARAWRALEGSGRDAGNRPIGSSAYEAYRISHGIAARPGELSESRNPYEAGIREDISFSKGCYIGQEVIARLDTYQKVRKGLAGVVFSGGAPGGPGQKLMKGEREVGELTSAHALPVMGRFLGLAVVAEADVHLGDQIVAAESGARGRVVPFPINPADA